MFDAVDPQYSKVSPRDRFLNMGKIYEKVSADRRVSSHPTVP